MAAARDDAADATPRVRSVEKLHVHPDTLACALMQRCRPCCYKIVLHSRAGLLPNQRPEMCPRMAATGKRKRVIGLYDAQHVARILTVGDGNFSFSLALARALQGDDDGAAPVELVVTSHESRDSVVETYPDGARILEELASMPHVQVHHGVDATDAAQMQALGTFDRVLWNFPCVRVPRGQDGQNEEMELNKALLSSFFGHVAAMLTPGRGQVHVTHKTKPPYSQWGIEALAEAKGLVHVRSVVFDRCLYPGYTNKKVLSRGSFPIWDSQTFVFAPATHADETVELTPVTTELLEKVYLRLTPTLDEQMLQASRLEKLQRKQKKGSGTAPATKKRERPAKGESGAPTGDESEANATKKAKTSKPQKHMANAKPAKKFGKGKKAGKRQGKK
ncbi:hypothetical protein P43SY_000553 [Pythium insidiosum]|uniref:25S rRNA (uridine-N(3))-methyltransferase BMT5-like domain-containing protein n=1 Tax=Pythium insidiosum TaxID=114742 RepID=A0AAD5LH24_PYTIN|nr:hypothetical protein P43SY_000553 [Pythium insidiosum]